jgi:prolyl 4-hydroxylase
MNNFIKEYKATNDMCDALIKFYKENEDKASPGVVGETSKGVHQQSLINKEHKDSMDITISKYDIRNISTEYGNFLFDSVKDYIESVVWDSGKGGAGPMELWDAVNIQHYKPGGGYKDHHCERTHIDNCGREMAWMTYLTDTPNGGTAFPQWDFTSECVKGKTLIWPAGFTHYHHGIISDTHEKMIITGWVTWQLPRVSKDG